MTKSKTFWAFTALLSLGVTVFSGYSVYERLNLHFSGDTLNIKSAPVPPLPEPVKPPEPAAVQEPVPAQAAAPAKETAAAAEVKKSEPEKIRPKKPGLEHKEPKPKPVPLADGSTSGKAVKTEKKGGAWKSEAYILPGYPYPAPVDGAAEGTKKSEPEKLRALKTLFEYKDTKAKSVYVTGSFTSWKKVKMTKKDGSWKAEVYILPGTYSYHFIADGSKKTDPGKSSTPAGNSIITIASH